MGVFDNIKNKAEELVGKDNVTKAEGYAEQHSDKVEQYSDQGLDAVSGKADDLTGGKYTDHITKARDAADARIGSEGAVPAQDAGVDGVDPVERDVQP